jgi:hypothetical protein
METEIKAGPEDIKATVRDCQKQKVIAINLIRSELEDSNKRGVRNNSNSSGLGNGTRHQEGEYIEERVETTESDGRSELEHLFP